MFTQRIYPESFKFPVTLLEKPVCIADGASPDSSLYITMFCLLYKRAKGFKVSCFIGGPETLQLLDDDPANYKICFVKTDQDPETFCSGKALTLQENFLSEKLKKKISLRALPEKNAGIVFLRDHFRWPDTVTWHAVQFILPKFFKVFDEQPLTKDETSFLLTLTQIKDTFYNEAAKKIVESQNFKDFVTKFVLSEFERKMYTRKVKAAEDALTSIEKEMQEALEKYRIACERRLNTSALLLGLKEMERNQETNTETQTYLENNPHVSNVTVADTHIRFIAKTELVPYFCEEWETLTQRGYLSRFTGSYSKEDVSLLLNAIFSENRSLKLRMCAYFDMDYFGSSVKSCVRYDYLGTDNKLKDYVPNPHLNMHNCMGQNAEAILEQLKAGDMIGAIECAIACAQRVNIHESFTFEPFIRGVLSNKNKIITTLDGTELTVDEAIEYLKGNQNE